MDVLAPPVEGGPNLAVLTGFAQWVDPSPSVLVAIDAAPQHLLGGTWVFTIRIRNRTTGIMIAQGDLTVVFGPDIVEEE